MLKSGLIVGAVMLVLSLGGSLLTPLCVPCLALVVGIGAGYLAGTFDNPIASGASAQVGAGAGAIAGVGALIGHLLGGVVNVILLGPERTADVLRQLGLPASADASTYYAALIGGSCCFGVFEVLLMAGVGAVGGLIWYQIRGEHEEEVPPGIQ
jgi:hypothetical protein